MSKYTKDSDGDMVDRDLALECLDIEEDEMSILDDSDYDPDAWSPDDDDEDDY